MFSRTGTFQFDSEKSEFLCEFFDFARGSCRVSFVALEENRSMNVSITDVSDNR